MEITIAKAIYFKFQELGSVKVGATLMKDLYIKMVETPLVGCQSLELKEKRIILVMIMAIEETHLVISAEKAATELVKRLACSEISDSSLPMDLAL